MLRSVIGSMETRVSVRQSDKRQDPPIFNFHPSDSLPFYRHPPSLSISYPSSFITTFCPFFSSVLSVGADMATLIYKHMHGQADSALTSTGTRQCTKRTVACRLNLFALKKRGKNTPKGEGSILCNIRLAISFSFCLFNKLTSSETMLDIVYLKKESPGTLFFLS